MKNRHRIALIMLFSIGILSIILDNIYAAFWEHGFISTIIVHIGIGAFAALPIAFFYFIRSRIGFVITLILLFFLYSFVIYDNITHQPDFQQALRGGNIEAIEELIQHGIEVNSIDSNPDTPLIEACQYRYDRPRMRLKNKEHLLREQQTIISIMHILIDNGADVNKQSNRDGLTPLHYAAIRKMPDVVQFLLKNGARPNIRDNEGRTPFVHLCWWGKGNVHLLPEGPIIITRALIEYGADPTIKDNNGKDVLDYIDQDSFPAFQEAKNIIQEYLGEIGNEKSSSYSNKNPYD